MSLLYQPLWYTVYKHDYSWNKNYKHKVHAMYSGAPNSGGVAEGQPRFDKGGVAIIFPFSVLKISLFRVFTLSD